MNVVSLLLPVWMVLTKWKILLGFLFSHSWVKIATGNKICPHIDHTNHTQGLAHLSTLVGWFYTKMAQGCLQVSATNSPLRVDATVCDWLILPT